LKSQNKKISAQKNTLNDNDVKEYLENHINFFVKNNDLLNTLIFPHEVGDSVSLVERQITVLREKHSKLESQIKEIIEFARVNEALTKNIFKLSARLIIAKDIKKTFQICNNSLKNDFDIDVSTFILFNEIKVYKNLAANNFTKLVSSNDQNLGPFKKFLSRNIPYCGRKKKSEYNFLFIKKIKNQIKSIALIPLGKMSELGFLAIGSFDEDRFHPGMRTDFLLHISELITSKIKSL